MTRLDATTLSALVKLLIFMVVTAVATSVLAIIIGNISFGSSKTYRAEFVDATGLVKGDDIRIAGVKVGTVKGISIVDRTRALVTFDVQSSTALTRSTHADIRYRNLVGQRYIALTNEIGSTEVLRPGSTIPVSRTSPGCSTGSSRCSRHCRPPTSTSCPTRSSRSSRARAGRSTTCSPTRRRSPRRWRTATKCWAT
jgi:ABC-type transporter Mla subunit MlaD